MFMQQGGVPMRSNVGGAGMPMNNFGQGPNVLPGPLAFLEKTTSNIGKTNLNITSLLTCNYMQVCMILAS